jgi:hypothetical protein
MPDQPLVATFISGRTVLAIYYVLCLKAVVRDGLSQTPPGRDVA